MITVSNDYPQGSDYQLYQRITQKQIPDSLDTKQEGFVALPLMTAYHVYQAVKFRMPLIERCLTLSGSCMVRPQNIWVRTGALFEDVIESSGGFLRFPKRIVMGGSMRGISQQNLKVPVIKATEAILALPKEETVFQDQDPCIRCGDCIDVCPMPMNPAMIIQEAENRRWKQLRRFNPQFCISCGNCSYVCPSHISIVPIIQDAALKAKEYENGKQ